MRAYHLVNTHSESTMKTPFVSSSALVLGALLTLGGLAATASALAGPGPQYWASRLAQAPAASVAQTPAAATEAAHPFPACTTSEHREARHAGLAGKGAETWATSVDHACGHCGGDIAVVNGQTRNTMGANCTMCVAGSVSPCAAAVAGVSGR